MSEWQDFEKAVADFVRALDKNAVVEHNIYRPDRDTGLDRQYDVWVEVKVCRIFPISVLISCKRKGRKVSVTDIDSLIGEIHSSGAHKGVLYSYAGFTQPAIKKAKANGISLCRLYINQPPDIPEVLALSFFCCAPSFRIISKSETMNRWSNTILDDILSLTVEENRTVLDLLEEEFQRKEKEAAVACKRGTLPEPWNTAIQIEDPKACGKPLIIISEGIWRVYRAKVEAHLVDGTYSFTEGDFLGTQSSPWIDRHSSEPGPGWERVENPAKRLQPYMGLVVLYGGNFRKQVVEAYGGRTVKDLT